MKTLKTQMNSQQKEIIEIKNMNTLKTQMNSELKGIIEKIKKRCNIKDLRPFQLNGLITIYYKHQKFLTLKKYENTTFISACPGAGKTLLSIMASLMFFDFNWATKIVIVSPSSNIKKQWQDECKSVGLDITSDKSNLKCMSFLELDNYIGRSITYQSFTSEKAINQLHDEIKKHNTIYVMDEAHHMALQNSWGQNAKFIEEFAIHKILLTGTPFRTKGNERIPFAKGELVNGCWEYEHDISYTYEDGLKYGSHVKMYIHTSNGEIKWKKGLKTYKKTFTDVLSEPIEISSRLTAALQMDGSNNFLPEMLHKANAHLTELRKVTPTAQGLIVAMDSSHAQNIKQYLESIGEIPRIALHDIKNSEETIKDFKKFPHQAHHKWIISVKMLAEGTDIKTLVMGVYATNIVTASFSIQIGHRLTRFLDGKSCCYWYIPEDERIMKTFMTFSKIVTIHEEKEQEILQQKKLEDIITPDLISSTSCSSFKAIESHIITSSIHSIVDQTKYENPAIFKIAKAMQESGAWGHLQFDEIYKHIENLGTSKNETNVFIKPRDTRTLEEILKTKRSDIQKLINTNIYILKKKGLHYSHKDIRARLYTMMGLFTNDGGEKKIKRLENYSENELEEYENKAKLLFSTIVSTSQPIKKNTQATLPFKKI